MTSNPPIDRAAGPESSRQTSPLREPIARAATRLFLAILLFQSFPGRLQADPTVDQIAYLKASNSTADWVFGRALAVSGNTVVVGADGEASGSTGVNGNENDTSAYDSGAVYVFVVDENGDWTQQAYLKASNTRAGDRFGYSVDISGDTIVVGALWEDSSATGIDGNQNDDLANSAGAAYVFVRNGTTWTQQAYLKASNTDAGDEFGYSVAIDGDTVVVGARNERSNATGIDGDEANNSAVAAGAAYVFVRNGVTWTQQAYVKASNTKGANEFGNAVDISGDTMVVGAYREDGRSTGINGDQSQTFGFENGAAYVYVRNGTTWTQQAYLKSSNNESGDQFGQSVAIDGDTIVAGAPWEDSNTTGVNGNEVDNTETWAGAAYVFVRNGSNWSQQAYLKASNTEDQDHFGWSVGVSGEGILVGAYREDGDANGLAWSGASYLFLREGTGISQLELLRASNADDYDQFGVTAAIDGGLLVVAADEEDSSAQGIDGGQNDDGEIGSGSAYAFEVSPPPAPLNLSAADGLSTSSVALTWDASEKATSYLVYRHTSDDPDNATLLGTVSGLSFNDSSVPVAFQSYFYWVRAGNTFGTGAFSVPDTGFRTLPAPLYITATDNLDDHVTVSWPAVDGATGYRVYRHATDAGGGGIQIADIATTSYNDTGVGPGAFHYYWVDAYNGGGNSVKTGPDGGLRKLEEPTDISASDGTSVDHVTVTWTAAPGATGYRIYRGNTGNLVGATTGTSFNDTTVTPGTSISYWVRAFNDTGAVDGVSLPGGPDAGLRRLSPPATLSATDGEPIDRVRLTWNGSPGANRYDLFRNTTDVLPGTPLVSGVTGLSYEDTTADAATTYFYWVRSRSNDDTSEAGASTTGFRYGGRTLSQFLQDFGLADPDGDPDLDGSTTFSEWGFGGTDPLQGGAVPSRISRVLEFTGTRYLTLSFLRQLGGSSNANEHTVRGTVYRCEGSAGLGVWDQTPVSVAPPGDLPPAPEGYGWVCYRLPFGVDQAMGFLRVTVFPEP